MWAQIARLLREEHPESDEIQTDNEVGKQRGTT